MPPKPILAAWLCCCLASVPCLAAADEADQATSDPVTLDPLVVRGMVASTAAPAERLFDPDSIAAYGLDTVGDLLGRIAAEQGDVEEPPVILVNGELGQLAGGVSGYPAEAVARLEVLPRGAAAPLGGRSTARAYNVVLRPDFRSKIATIAHQVATEGGAASLSGSFNTTRIAESGRLNATLRLRHEPPLLESERALRDLAGETPYALGGVVVPDPRAGFDEIDPMLSAFAGATLIAARAPAGIDRPSLADFALDSAGATDQRPYRTLRPEAWRLESDLSAFKRLSDRLTGSATLQANWIESRSLLGLPPGLLILPQTNLFSPFSRDVGLAIYGRAPAGQRRRDANVKLEGSVNAILSADWRGSLAARLAVTDQQTRITTRGLTAGIFPLLEDAAVNPFTEDLTGLLELRRDRAKGRGVDTGLRASLWGAFATLPAGKVRGSLTGELSREELHARSSLIAQGALQRSRTETAARVTAELPISSGATLPWIGDAAATLEYAVADNSQAGALNRSNLALTWTPRGWITVQASRAREDRAPPLAYLNAPVLRTPGVRVFDLVSGETVEVTSLQGGGDDLGPDTVTTRRLSLSLKPFARWNLQIRSDYAAINARNVTAGLPVMSREIIEAFPERFVRDETGRLTEIDFRPITLDRQAQEQLSLGFSLEAPLGETNPETGALSLRPRLQLSASHSWSLTDEVRIRSDGARSIDLLSGGALGHEGGRPKRHFTANLGLSRPGMGVQLSGSWRAPTQLRLGGELGDELRFSPLTLFDLRAYLDLAAAFPTARWADGARATFSVGNLTSARQEVRDHQGHTPHRYQPAYLDPLGRTLRLELRKAL